MFAGAQSLLRSLSFIVPAVILSFVFPGSASHAAVWHVRLGGSVSPDGRSWGTAFAHPAEAAAAALPGDEIWVASGEYLGDEIRIVPGVRLIGGFTGVEADANGQGRDPSTTTLTPADGRTGIVVAGQGGPEATVIAGFTFRPARGLATTGRGLVATNAALVVEHCRFEGFRATTRFENPGSALWCKGGRLTVAGCTFAGNSVTGTDGYGAALGAFAVDPILIRSNLFIGNTGGAAPCLAFTECLGEVSDNRFIGNLAFTNAVPGAVELYRCGIAVLRNRFLFNRGGFGSALFIFERLGDHTNRVEFNLFAGGLATWNNTAFPVGAVSIARFAVARVLNNTFIGNTESPLEARNTIGPVASDGPQRVTLANNLFIGHAGGQSCAAWPGASRNLVIDIDSEAYSVLRESGVPDALADREIVGGIRGFSFRLTGQALARGFGDPRLVAPGATDAEGRPVPHPDGTVDVGAFAYHPGGEPLPPRILHLRPEGDDAASGSSWAEAVRTLPGALARVDISHPTEVWLAGGTYEAVSGTQWLPPNLTLRGGFLGNETSPSQRPAQGTVTSRIARGSGQFVLPLFGNGPWNEFDRLELDLSGTRLLPSIQSVGILGRSSWPWIHHCSFVGMKDGTNTTALRLDGGIVEDCTFTGFESIATFNNLRLIQIQSLGPVAVFRRNRVEGNQVSGRTAALGAFGAMAQVNHNLWRSNSISGTGSALLSTFGPPFFRRPALLQHNTLLENVVTDGSQPAGALFTPVTGSPPVVFRANLVVSNRGVIRLDAADAATARDNLLHANGNAVPANPLNPQLNSTTDPQLLPGDWHLPPGSPAIDAVRSPRPEAFASDLDGHGAWLGRFPDIGADESLPPVTRADSIAAATLQGSGIPMSGVATWTAVEPACDDCFDRTWRATADGDGEIGIRPRPGCTPPSCPEPDVRRSLQLDLSPAHSGVRLVQVTVGGVPARTLGIWVPPPLLARLQPVLAAGSPGISLERHPAVIIDVSASPDLRIWEPVNESELAGYVASRAAGSWFFRIANR